MPLDDLPLGSAIDALAAAAPSRVALRHGPEIVTRAELAASSSRAAREFAELGVRAGDLVTIGLGNGTPFYAAVIGAWKLGAVPQPVSAKLPSAELSALIEIADPAVVVGLLAPDGRPSLPPTWRPDGTRDPSPLPRAVPPSWKAPTSGGSTGRPKIIVAGNPGTLAAVTARAPRLRIQGDVDGAGEVFAVTAPLYHNAPFMFSLMSLVLGGTVVVLDRFDGHTVLDAVVRHRVTWLYAVPTLMGRLLRLPADERAAADVSSVRTLLHVGAPCPEHVKRGCIEWFGAETVLELYAGTESQATAMIDGREWLAHPGSVGRVVSGEMRIGDAEGRPLPVGQTGEVWMKVPESPYRYLGAEARRRDGWDSLGDLGRMDADGYLYLADRRTDMILVGGSNVYPAEVEAALDSHPAVLSSCVIGLPDDDLGSRVHALVQLAAPVGDEELRAHVAARLARQKVPATIERVDHPLRDDTGKVRRSALRAARLPAPDGEVEPRRQWRDRSGLLIAGAIGVAVVAAAGGAALGSSGTDRAAAPPPAPTAGPATTLPKPLPPIASRPQTGTRPAAYTFSVESDQPVTITYTDGNGDQVVRPAVPMPWSESITTTGWGPDTHPILSATGDTAVTCRITDDSGAVVSTRTASPTATCSDLGP